MHVAKATYIKRASKNEDGMRNLLLTLAAVVLVGSASAHDGEHSAKTPPWQQASAWPDRIVVTFASDPARTIAVSWRTDPSAEVTQAQIVKATPDARFDAGAETVTARTEPLDLARVPGAKSVLTVSENAGLPPVHYHSAMFSGLEPDTLYAYRVSGGQGKWSEWFQVRTAPLSGPVSFLYLGDAQNGILSHWARTIRAAYAKAPDARFIIHAGDLVNQGSRDFEWAQWFKAVGFIHGMIPAVPVAGNHEYSRVGADPATAQRMLSIVWRPQFMLPVDETLPDDLKETVYSVRYGSDLEIFVLDTNAPDVAVQARWLDAKLANSTARWRVATFHHPVFSSAGDRDNPRQRSALLPVLKKHDVDLVLQGHDHTYARGTLPQTPERFSTVEDEIVDTMFVNSVSGPKQYKFATDGWDRYAADGVRLDRQAENTQFFQLVRIDGANLVYEAYTVDGQIYDRFALYKGANGEKRLVKGPASTMNSRAFANTLDYDGADPLKD
jgi:3',5'-cyclic AMP phosphodiesterase CpdA